MNYLFVTIKRVGKRLPTEADYMNYLNALDKEYTKQNNPLLNICKQVIETDDHGRKHLHMIILERNDFNWNSLKLYKTNWHVHTIKIESADDLERISNYMDKEDNTNVFIEAVRQGAYLFQ